MLRKTNTLQENDVIMQLWRAKLTQAARQPWLASYLLRHSARLYAELRRFYQQLVTFICAGLRGRRLRRLMRTLPALLAGGGLALAVAFQAPATRAANITVNSTVDEILATLALNGTCDLREAIQAANTNMAVGQCPAGDAGSDIISLPAGTITLAAAGLDEDGNDTGDLDILDVGGPLTINGAAGGTIIDGAGLDRVLHVLDSTLSLSSVTISGGSVISDAGGGIRNDGSLTMTGSAVVSNTAEGGGGISSCNSFLTVTGSTVSSNTAIYGGGGIYNYDSTVTVTDSTISGNIAEDGGGIYNDSFGPLMTLANSTISGNTATDYGGGIYNSTADLIATNTTITGNTADSDNDDTGDGGGLFRQSGAIIVVNSIIALNVDASVPGPDHPDVSGFVSGNNRNLLSSTTGAAGTIGTGTDIVTTTLNLGPLANNGGNTQTHALLAGSPAIDAAKNTVCAATPISNLDQRGQSRTGLAADGDQNGTVTCDIGAFELLGILIHLPIIFKQ